MSANLTDEQMAAFLCWLCGVVPLRPDPGGLAFAFSKNAFRSAEHPYSPGIGGIGDPEGVNT
jgi:hypothetical protein